MKKIWIITHFTDDFDGIGNDRFLYLSSLLLKHNYEIELITSDFSHTKKKFKRKISQINDIKVTQLHEPGYKKNISLGRIYSNYIISRSFKRYIRQSAPCDLILLAVPSLFLGVSVINYALRNRITTVIDVQDLWPEAFKMKLNIPFLSNLLFFPATIMADYIYKHCNAIMAVSETYLARAQTKNSNSIINKAIYLGTDLSLFDKYRFLSCPLHKGENEFWITYVGTVGHSYDLKTVFNAVNLIHFPNNMKPIIVILGDGPLMDYYKKLSIKCGIPVKFHGRMQYSEMVSILCLSDVTVNPIAKNAAQSIINKHADYTASGLPIVNTQDSVEFITLLNKYEAGLTSPPGDNKSLASNIQLLVENPSLRKKLGEGSRKLAEDLFDRNKTYNDFVNIIKSLVN